MSCSVTYWLLGGAWFQCRNGAFGMSSCQLMFPGVRSFLVFPSFGFKPPASGFQSYSFFNFFFKFSVIVASWLLYPYSPNDKISSLMVKRFSTVRDTQRGSQSYMKKRRISREIEVTRKRRRGVKRRETDPASDQFPKCSPQPRTHREIHRVG